MVKGTWTMVHDVPATISKLPIEANKAVVMNWVPWATDQYPAADDHPLTSQSHENRMHAPWHTPFAGVMVRKPRSAISTQ
jgi:hypothetical protein